MNFRSSLAAKNLARFKLITFDVTDTLLTFSRPPEIQYAMAARRHGCHNIDEAALSKCFKKHFKRMASDHPNFGRSTYGWLWWWQTVVSEVFRESHEHLDEQKISKIADQLIQDYQTADCWKRLDFADEAIVILKQFRKEVGIISNFDPRLASIITALKLPAVDFIVTSYEAGEPKPNLVIFDYALSRCKENVAACEALHIGNTPKLDYLGAKHAGWSSILVNGNFDEDVSQPLEINPKHVFKNLREFICVLETVEFAW